MTASRGRQFGRRAGRSFGIVSRLGRFEGEATAAGAAGSNGMNRKWLMVLPNLFTVTSIFCGLLSVVWSGGARGDTLTGDLHRAAMAIVVGMFCDALDGRVARLTRTQSDFGVQLDSLADVVTFGLAPAVLLYRWALEPLGRWGLAAAGLYVACGAIRLARFNVAAAECTGPSKNFVGLPIPLAAGMLVAVVEAAAQASPPLLVQPMPAAVLSLVLSYLMVSTIRYPSFKTVRLEPRTWLAALLLVAGGGWVALTLGPGWVLLAYVAVYLVFGLVAELLARLQGRLPELDAEPPAPGPAELLDK